MGDTGVRSRGGDPGGGRSGWQESWTPTPELHGRLVAYACTIVGPGEAEDVAQETLLRVGRAHRTLRDHGRADAWLFRICRHVAIDLLRSRRVRSSVWAPIPEGHEDTEPADGRLPGAPPPQTIEWTPLSAHQRLLLCLHAVRGLSQARLSASTGLSPPALRVRLFRARRALAAAGIKAARPVRR